MFAKNTRTHVVERKKEKKKKKKKRKREREREKKIKIKKRRKRRKKKKREMAHGSEQQYLFSQGKVMTLFILKHNNII